ncbi:MAG: DUF411 domain-containing protein [Gemmatimonadetes bacterium]|nr:DUF411 domain-containing protein [Gemmatimonadota bacterium]
MATQWKNMAVGAAAVLVAATTVAAVVTRNAEAVTITVYKSPTCGCCSKWIDHLRANGYEVTAVDVADLAPVKAEQGIRAEFAACHTAIVEGYVIEGHVPADVIDRLLEERPNVAGLAVAGMPMGSPGMEGPRKDPYNVLAFDAAGNTTVYESR